jgi:hypothetical protein
MSALFAMSLPALVLLLSAVGAVEVLVARRRRRTAPRASRTKVAAVGFDALGLALSPGQRHKQEHDEFMELDREQPGDGAPPRSAVDLDAGTARIVLPPGR